MSILFKRGNEANRTGFVPKEGEPVFTKDKKELYVGDGVTPGGVPVGAIKSEGAKLGELAIFKDAAGKLLGSKPISEITAGFASEARIQQLINQAIQLLTAGDTKVKNAEHADTADTAASATNALQLGQVSFEQYALKSDIVNNLNTLDISTDYTEGDDAKVASGGALKGGLDWLKGLIDGLSTSKLDKSALSSATNSQATDKAATSNAVYLVKQVADTASSVVKNLTRDVAELKTKLPTITHGSANPSGGDNGDIYFQYR